jgi:magnesium-transporting ATPase (P-type)
VGIVRQFPFSSALQRMAVICKQIGQEQLHFFCKGSPEMIQSLSKPDTGWFGKTIMIHFFYSVNLFLIFLLAF